MWANFIEFYSETGLTPKFNSSHIFFFFLHIFKNYFIHFLLSQVDHEVKRFTWNLENLKILATNPNLRDTHVFPFSIGSTIDRASKWKFFLSPDNNNNARFPLSIAFYVQLVEYSGTEEIPIELQISVMGDNNWRYAVCKDKNKTIRLSMMR